MTLEKPHGLNWNAAGMELPEMPMVTPGADAMSMTIAGVLPTLAAELTASVTALAAKENMFSGKLTAAESAYNNADDQGSQSVGQLTSMLGEVGKMAQSAGQGGGGAGGGGGIFGSLMEQAMKMADGMGGKDDGQQEPDAQAAAPPAAPAAPSAAPQASGGPGAGGQGGPGHTSGAGAAAHQTREAPREELPPTDAAAPGENQRGAGPAPIAPHQPAHRSGDDDIERRL